MGLYDDFGLNNTVPKKKNSFFSFLIACLEILVLFVCILLLITGFTNTITVESNKENIEMDLSNIPEPQQYNASGGVALEINGGTADITYVAEYILSGRVVDVQLYVGSSVADKLSPKDIGVAWGFLASDESKEKVKWSSSGNRFLYWNIPDGSWYQMNGGKKAITSHHSNNHLIPSNDKVSKLIKKIKKDDYVQVKGYLVKIYWTNDEGKWYRWNTSMSRDDDGDGACEIIYVTDVKWLN